MTKYNERRSPNKGLKRKEENIINKIKVKEKDKSDISSYDGHDVLTNQDKKICRKMSKCQRNTFDILWM